MTRASRLSLRSQKQRPAKPREREGPPVARVGIFDFLGKYCVCGACGEPRAWKLFGKTKCQNMSCVNFDRDYLAKERETLEQRRIASVQSRPTTGSFDPGDNKLDLQYTNFLGVEGTYTGDKRTVWRTNDHISLLLCPTGRRVSFARSRIKNLSDLEQWVKNPPSGRERQVLNYHKKRQTTSPRYEQLRKKYPDY